MKDIYKKITVDLSRKSNSRLIFTRQNDVGGRVLMINLTDGGAPYSPEIGNSASLNFKRSDGVSGAVAATVGKMGIIIITIPQIALGAVGETVCSVSLYDGNGKKLTSSDFYLDVIEELYSGENIDDQPEYSLLQSVFTEVAKFTRAEEARDQAEKTREENEKARAQSESLRDEKLVANLGLGGSIVVAKNGWSGEMSQNIKINGLGEDDLITFYPASRLDRETAGIYGLFVDPEPINGTVVFTSTAKPIADVTLKYFITKGRGE